jgi:hypothetical protein
MFKRQRCSRRSSCGSRISKTVRQRLTSDVGSLRDVEEAVLVLVLLVDGGHQRGSRREDLIDEDEDGLLRRELDALADHVDKLSNCEVGGDQVLLLVDDSDVRLLHLLADDL